MYQALLDRYKKLTEQQETIEAGAEVISNAPVPSGPSFPQPKLIIAVGFTGSLVVAGARPDRGEHAEWAAQHREIERALACRASATCRR